MPVGFEAITSGASGFLQTAMYWAGYLVFAVLIGVGCWAFYYYNQFKIKMTYWPIFGNGRDSYTIDKPKKTRFKMNKTRTAWQLFGKKRTIEPFDAKFIYPGNNVYAFKYGDNYLPVRMNFGNLEDKDAVSDIEPVPYYVKNWQLQELKQNEIEFSKKDFWSQNKTLIVTMVVAIGCLGLCAVTVYYCLKTATGGADNISQLTGAVRVLTSKVGGVAPA